MSETPFLLTPDGHHGLCWWRDDLPVDIYLGDNCGHLFEALQDAIHYWEETAGRRLFTPPQDAIADMLNAFNDATLRPGLIGMVLVSGTGDDPNHGDTDLRQDNHDGHIRSALVTLPRSVGPYFATVVRHELGHVLGLAHWHEGLMVARPESPDTVPPLADAQHEALRHIYG